MTAPRIGQGMPVNDGWIAQKLADMQRQINELRAARTLDASTISPDGTLTVDGTLDVAGSLNVTGELDVTGATTLDSTLTVAGTVQSDDYVAGTSGWKLDGSSDNAEFNQLTLRNGIVGLDALSAPVVPAVADSGFVGSLTFTNSFVTYATETVTVPSGFTRALVFATANAFAASSASGMSCTARAVVAGNNGPSFATLGPGQAFTSAPYASVQTGLSGTMTVQVQAEAGPSIISGACFASVTAMILFLR